MQNNRLSEKIDITESEKIYMGKVFGIWKLDKPILCRKEISGKKFSSKIGDTEVQLCFPSCPETYDHDNMKFLNGDLIAPMGVFADKIDWGTIHAWPEGLFSVNYLLCLIMDDEVDFQKIYTDFLEWKEKFYNLCMIEDGDFIHPEQKMPSFLQYGNGIYDGLELFRRQDEEKIVRLINNRKLEPIKIELVSRDQCYDLNKMETLFHNAGSEKQISLPYELLIVAYRAVLRYDFRSAIIIGGTALERAILHRIEKHYKDNNRKGFKKDKHEHRMLWRRFQWLKELKINIPIQNYQTEIIDVRNPTAHEGKNYSFDRTKKYLDKCMIIIKEYCPNVLEE